MTTDPAISDPRPILTLPFADADLARRLERAEGATNAAFVDARTELDPDSGATWTTVAGVYAMYDGPDSPLTQTFGLGIFEPVGAAELDALEAFFRERGAPTMHEASPFLAPETLALLGERGYRPMELSTVLVRLVTLDDPAEKAGAVTARRIDPGEEGMWGRVSVEGWSGEAPELGPFFETFGRLITRARGVHCFVAELDGRPVAAAALSLHDDIALLAGASTIPAARRRGAQRALLESRLRFAASRGARLAMVVTQPGSASQRNAERQGFRVCYTRTKWRLERSRLSWDPGRRYPAAGLRRPARSTTPQHGGTMKFHAYLMFNGDCAEAFRFYQELLGGELDITTHADAPGAEQVPEGWGDRVMHAALTVGDQLLMASDTPPEHYQRPAGTYVSVSLDTVEEARRVFDGLAEGAQIQMPFQSTFWSPGFGMLADRWGTPWMVGCSASAEEAASPTAAEGASR